MAVVGEACRYTTDVEKEIRFHDHECGSDHAILHTAVDEVQLHSLLGNLHHMVEMRL